MSESKTYKLTNRPQLIDLNAELVNFELEFLVKSFDPKKEFNAIILTQEQLDGIDLNKIEMKKANGEIGGNIKADNDKYQNYFLILKKLNETDEDFDVEVNLHLNKLEKSNDVSSPSNNMIENDTSFTDSRETVSDLSENKPIYKRLSFWIIIGIIVIIIIYYLCKRYSSKSKTSLQPRLHDSNNLEIYTKLNEVV
jgi:hypothetical protein